MKPLLFRQNVKFKTPDVESEYDNLDNDVRDVIDSSPYPLRITSGSRTVAQNTSVGGVPNSYHTKNRAVDIGLEDDTPDVESYIKSRGGVPIREKDHLHVQFPKHASYEYDDENGPDLTKDESSWNQNDLVGSGGKYEYDDPNGPDLTAYFDAQRTTKPPSELQKFVDKAQGIERGVRTGIASKLEGAAPYIENKLGLNSDSQNRAVGLAKDFGKSIIDTAVGIPANLEAGLLRTPEEVKNNLIPHPIDYASNVANNGVQGLMQGLEKAYDVAGPGAVENAVSKMVGIKRPEIKDYYDAIGAGDLGNRIVPFNEKQARMGTQDLMRFLGSTDKEEDVYKNIIGAVSEAAGGLSDPESVKMLAIAGGYPKAGLAFVPGALRGAYQGIKEAYEGQTSGEKARGITNFLLNELFAAGMSRGINEKAPPFKGAREALSRPPVEENIPEEVSGKSPITGEPSGSIDLTPKDYVQDYIQKRSYQEPAKIISPEPISDVERIRMQNRWPWQEQPRPEDVVLPKPKEETGLMRGIMSRETSPEDARAKQALDEIRSEMMTQPVEVKNRRSLQRKIGDSVVPAIRYYGIDPSDPNVKDFLSASGLERGQASQIVRKGGIPIDILRENLNELGYGPYETIVDMLHDVERESRLGKKVRPNDYATPESEFVRMEDEYRRQKEGTEDWENLEKEPSKTEVPKTAEDHKFGPQEVEDLSQLSIPELIKRGFGSEVGSVGKLTKEQAAMEASARAARGEILRRANETGKDLFDGLQKMGIPPDLREKIIRGYINDFHSAIAKDKSDPTPELRMDTNKFGSGETKKSGLTRSMEEVLGDEVRRPQEYEVRAQKNQVIPAADKFVRENPDLAEKLAMRSEAFPPELVQQGLWPEDVYSAVKRKAAREGDSDLMMKLARSPQAQVARLLGQRTKALDSMDTLDPIQAIQDIEDVRQKSFEKRTLKNVGKTIEAEVNKMGSYLKNLTSRDWNDLIESIKCK